MPYPKTYLVQYAGLEPIQAIAADVAGALAEAQGRTAYTLESISLDGLEVWPTDAAADEREADDQTERKREEDDAVRMAALQPAAIVARLEAAEARLELVRDYLESVDPPTAGAAHVLEAWDLS